MVRTYPTVATVRSAPLQRFISTIATVQPPNCRDGLQTAVARDGSDPDSGAGMLRVMHTRETRFKKNQAG